MGAMVEVGRRWVSRPLEITAAVTWKLQGTSRAPPCPACSLAVTGEDTEHRGPQDSPRIPPGNGMSLGRLGQELFSWMDSVESMLRDSLVSAGRRATYLG